MRPDPEHDSLAEDAPVWERNPVVAKALRDAMTVRNEGLSWREALPIVLAKRDVRLHELRSRPQRFLFGRGSGFRTQTLRATILSAGIGLALLAGTRLLRPTRQVLAITRTYVTNDHQQAAVTLNDGTQVTLAPNTTLRLIGFGTQTRTVVLDGEAYVNVARATGVPFIVRVGDAEAQVLGTGFLIRHQVGTARVHVVVADGKVRLAKRTGRQVSVTLTAGQMGDFTDSTVHVSTVNDLAPGTEWIHDHLMFHDVPFATVLATMSRWYGYQFRCADSALAQRTVTLGISARSSMDALSEIEDVLSVNLTVTGDTVTLTPQPPRHMNGGARVRTYDVWAPAREAGR